VIEVIPIGKIYGMLMKRSVMTLLYTVHVLLMKFLVSGLLTRLDN